MVLSNDSERESSFVPAWVWWTPVSVAAGAVLPDRVRDPMRGAALVAVAGIEQLGVAAQMAVAGVDWPPAAAVVGASPMLVGWPVAVVLLLVVVSAVRSGVRRWWSQ